ncbi:hypothetical protein BP5796_08186 [Coleophoma crateriformis]|uniref:Uncharacterized protein n=1 Tax=Coleophoma crateriformis TaxID=565419 RepID=A0A3D8RDQ2_9HELO|nr:hypothetical protein BP5796_08186 [Coleophoma crateriformis]
MNTKGSPSLAYPDPDPEREEAPPSYTSSVAPSSRHPKHEKSPENIPTHYGAQINAQLHALTNSLSSLHVQRSLLAGAKDDQILSLLTESIQTYIARFSTTGLRTGTLILIPSGAVVENGQPLPTMRDPTFGNRGEFDVVMRVGDAQAEGSESPAWPEAPGDEGGDLFWWTDGDMAQRLVQALRPQIEETEKSRDGNEEQQDCKTSTEPAQQSESTQPSKASVWGFLKKSSKNSAKPQSVAAMVPQKAASHDSMPSKTGLKEVKQREPDKENVIMHIDAEQIVFRYENDFGLLQTKTGWSIIVRLTILTK